MRDESIVRDSKDYLPYYIGRQCLTAVISPTPLWNHIVTITAISLENCRKDLLLYKPILRPLSDMKIEEGAWCLERLFFPGRNYPIRDFKLEFVGQDEKNPRISINNDWFTESLTFGNNYGSIWSTNCSAEHVKLEAEVFHYLIKQGFDVFSLIKDGLAKSTLEP